MSAFTASRLFDFSVSMAACWMWAISMAAAPIFADFTLPSASCLACTEAFASLAPEIPALGSCRGSMPEVAMSRPALPSVALR